MQNTKPVTRPSTLKMMVTSAKMYVSRQIREAREISKRLDAEDGSTVGSGRLLDNTQFSSLLEAHTLILTQLLYTPKI